ncbi:MAG: iron-containing redox enzyme family protein [Candidatus Thiodiazotropha taylori]|nr:iron-containing redox enzyme family protein [Candidatus Thiodiazotropha taylori]MCG7997312.1 iron-containing redox enzyme family protein [Candidatus Thiodiazotropha taylori]MCG8082207.1 iron-containing redox enzyme family protein [Candidatus Thiodiazotropha taylori]MCG8089258.1 iron-containing redox enzyme family protein [Candidatus Thiodiazotropha taylori]MCW4274631.1 iron-containing redox enzyme family protein [Candidatus Thiodiazotropha taylori]
MHEAKQQATGSIFSDLLKNSEADGPLLLPGVHPLPNLLSLDAEQVLDAFRQSQLEDFTAIISDLDASESSLHHIFEELLVIAAKDPDNRLSSLSIFQPGAMQSLFVDLHDHVMSHPVWRHPCFVRIFEGDFKRDQLSSFALNYFNQVKNTRQCVALAQGRFSGFIDLPYGCLNERVSELVQIVLAQLLADEYGVGTHSIESYPDLASLLGSTTHIVMYRNLFEGLGIPFEQQDLPMLPEVADNVLTQRLLAGHPSFSLLESLASVGLGMEWGVPEFFSLLLGGMIRWAWREEVELTQHHLIVFIAHVQYDVLHAISVMLATSLLGHEAGYEEKIKQATNMLMSSRYNMMSGLYRHLFDEPCDNIDQIGLESRYRITDRRIEQALLAARQEVADASVSDAQAYKSDDQVPFVFA